MNKKTMIALAVAGAMGTLVAGGVNAETITTDSSTPALKNQTYTIKAGDVLKITGVAGQYGLVSGSTINGGAGSKLTLDVTQAYQGLGAAIGDSFGGSKINVGALEINSVGYGIYAGPDRYAPEGFDYVYNVEANSIAINTTKNAVYTAGHEVTLTSHGDLTITSQNGSGLKAAGGTINVISDTAVINANNSEAIWVASNGKVNLSANTVTVNGDIKSDGTLNLNGNLVFNGDTAKIATLTGDNAKFTFGKELGQDALKITNNQASLTIAADSNVVSTIDDLKAMADVNGNVTWFIDGGLDGDDITETGGKTTYKTSKGVRVLKTVGTSLSKAAVLSLKNDVRKRLGDIRHVDAEQGAWVRYEGGRMSASGYSNKLNTLQIGYDTKALADGVRLGAAVSYTRNDGEIDGGAVDGDTYALSLYSTWMGDNGMYADVIARVASVKNDVTVLNGSQAFNDDMTNTAYSITGEFGQRFDIAKTFFVEPQVEMVYTYVDSGKLKLNNGNYKYDSIDSLIGRAGMVFGWTCPNDKGHVYFRASALHEFKGDSKLTTNSGNTFKTDGQDTWAELGLGAQYNVNKNVHVWADVERTQGADINEDFRGTLGVRVSF